MSHSSLCTQSVITHTHTTVLTMFVLASGRLVGTATIFVTLTMKWKDPRLKWDVNDDDTCANMVNVWTGYVSFYYLVSKDGKGRGTIVRDETRRNFSNPMNLFRTDRR